MLVKHIPNLKMLGFASHAPWRSKAGVLRTLAVLVLACIGCSAVGGSIRSQVLDAETGKPVAGAIALGQWGGPCDWRCPDVPFFGGRPKTWVHFQEAEADVQGWFALGIDLPFFLPVEEVDITVYRSGYIVWNRHHRYQGGDREVPSQILLKPVPPEHDLRKHWELINRVANGALYSRQFPKFREAARSEFPHEVAEIEAREEASRLRQETLEKASKLRHEAEGLIKHGKYAEAEPLLKRSLAIWEEVLGPDDQRMAQSLHSLAKVYQAQGKYAEAEHLFKRSLAIAKKFPYGEPYIEDYINKLKDYALLLRKMDRENEAKETEAHAKFVHEKNEEVKKIIRNRRLGAPWPDFPPSR